MTARNVGQTTSRPIGARKSSDASKPAPTEVDRYHFAAKRTLGLFSSAAKKLAIIIIAVIILVLVVIFLISS